MFGFRRFEITREEIKPDLRRDRRVEVYVYVFLIKYPCIWTYYRRRLNRWLGFDVYGYRNKWYWEKTYYGMDQNKSDISDSTVYVHIYDRNFVRFRRPDKV